MPVYRPKAVGLKETAFFTGQFAVMVRTALPVLDALEILAHQARNEALRAALLDIARRVREGRPLAASFARYPDIFDDVYVSLLAAGEAGGQLDVMLERLASHLEFHLRIKEKVRSALLYPTIVVATAIAVVAFLVLFVLPTFMEIFAQFQVALPLPTRILLRVSEAARRWWYLPLAGASAGWWYFRRWMLDPSHTRTVHALQLRLPIVGELARNVVMTRMLRTLGALTASGVPILKALTLAQATAGNVVFHDLLERVFVNVRDGRNISDALAGSPFVPDAVTGMIATGEKTGTLPEVIGKIADFYESETDTAIQNLFSILEPVFVIGLGFLVGGIAVAVLLPMFELARGMQ